MLYEIIVELQDIEPAIWRKLRVPARTSLLRLHKILQRAMGWTNSHLYLFEINGKKYGEPNAEWESDVLDSRKMNLENIFSGGIKSFVYEYDLGDGWRHVITLLGTVEGDNDKQAVCVDGARACPPEDCGGAGGYFNLLVALSDPTNEEYDDMLEWVDGKYNPSAFDIVTVNRMLKRIR